MAEVSTRSATSESIEHALDYSLREWTAVADLPGEWAEWDGIDKEVFQLEWVIKEDFLRDLRAWHAQGCFSAEQEGKYRALKALVARHRPTIERLFAGA